MSYQPLRTSLLESILAEQCMCHQERLWVRMIGQRQPGNESHLHKTWDCKPCIRSSASGFLTLLLSARGAPFPVKSLALSARVSPWTVHFWVRQEPIHRPWKGLPFLQHLELTKRDGKIYREKRLAEGYLASCGTANLKIKSLPGWQFKKHIDNFEIYFKFLFCIFLKWLGAIFHPGTGWLPEQGFQTDQEKETEE